MPPVPPVPPDAAGPPPPSAVEVAGPLDPDDDSPSASLRPIDVERASPVPPLEAEDCATPPPCPEPVTMEDASPLEPDWAEAFDDCPVRPRDSVVALPVLPEDACDQEEALWPLWVFDGATPSSVAAALPTSPEAAVALLPPAGSTATAVALPVLPDCAEDTGGGHWLPSRVAAAPVLQLPEGACPAVPVLLAWA
ncbi:MAG: hypothetical protein JOY68_08310 [Candidatus Dormibacteraeota bacterium]|nr:hypothetical protein [Candidatus Dormibacteraeota bacterium]